VAPRIPCQPALSSQSRALVGPPAETHILCAGECAVCPPFRLLSFLLSPFQVWDERAKESPIPAAIVHIRVQPEGRGPPCVRIESQRSPKRHGVFVTSATQLALTTTRSVTGTGGTFLLHVPRRRHLHQTLPVPSPRPITRTRISGTCFKTCHRRPVRNAKLVPNPAYLRPGTNPPMRLLCITTHNLSPESRRNEMSSCWTMRRKGSSDP